MLVIAAGLLQGRAPGTQVGPTPPKMKAHFRTEVARNQPTTGQHKCQGHSGCCHHAAPAPHPPPPLGRWRRKPERRARHIPPESPQRPGGIERGRGSSMPSLAHSFREGQHEHSVLGFSSWCFECWSVFDAHHGCRPGAAMHAGTCCRPPPAAARAWSLQNGGIWSCSFSSSRRYSGGATSGLVRATSSRAPSHQPRRLAGAPAMREIKAPQARPAWRPPRYHLRPPTPTPHLLLTACPIFTNAGPSSVSRRRSLSARTSVSSCCPAPRLVSRPSISHEPAIGVVQGQLCSSRWLRHCTCCGQPLVCRASSSFGSTRAAASLSLPPAQQHPPRAAEICSVRVTTATGRVCQ